MKKLVLLAMATTFLPFGCMKSAWEPSGNGDPATDQPASAAPESGIPYGNSESAGHYADVNGIQMYYEIYGTGEPLVLIHGNGDSIEAMSHQIEYFSRKYRVIVADSRGHGKSELGQATLTYEQMADDWATLLEQLDTGPADVVGWSDGGILGLLLGIHHPDSLKRLAAMGANLSPDTSAVYAWAPEWVHEKLEVVDTRIREGDTTQDWDSIRKTFELLVDQPNIPISDLRKIASPVLILAGDRDIIREEHTVSIYQNIPDAQLCIFPGQTHWVSQTDPELFNSTVERFFEAPFSKPDSKDILLDLDLGF